MREKQILLIGGGGHCRSCIDVIETDTRFKIAGIIEKPGRIAYNSVLGYPVIGTDDDLEIFRRQYDYAAIAIGQIGSPEVRQKVFYRLKQLKFKLPVIVSASAYVSKHASFGEGSMVMQGAIVNAGANIGVNCILNTGVQIDHDVCIGDHTHVSTASVVNGEAKVGKGSFVGSNATIVHKADLPDNYFYKAGTLVTDETCGSPIRKANPQ